MAFRNGFGRGPAGGNLTLSMLLDSELERRQFELERRQFEEERRQELLVEAEELVNQLVADTTNMIFDGFLDTPEGALVLQEAQAAVVEAELVDELMELEAEARREAEKRAAEERREMMKRAAVNGLLSGGVVGLFVLAIGLYGIHVFSGRFDGFEASLKKDLLKVAVDGKKEVVKVVKDRLWMKTLVKGALLKSALLKVLVGR